jgi:hypothetical protein
MPMRAACTYVGKQRWHGHQDWQTCMLAGLVCCGVFVLLSKTIEVALGSSLMLLLRAGAALYSHKTVTEVGSTAATYLPHGGGARGGYDPCWLVAQR